MATWGFEDCSLVQGWFYRNNHARNASSTMGTRSEVDSNDLVQDCTISVDNALEILQFCTETSRFWSRNIVRMLKILYGLVQDCSNSTANALGLLQSCTKPSISFVIQTTARWVRSPLTGDTNPSFWYQIYFAILLVNRNCSTPKNMQMVLFCSWFGLAWRDACCCGLVQMHWLLSIMRRTFALEVMKLWISLPE